MIYNVLSPLDSKEALRFFIMRLKEDSELDDLVEVYVRSCLRQSVIYGPSKGRFGEGGKDIVAIENKPTLEYCSYIVKRGKLNNNLDGPYGILKQMKDAIFIELPEGIYHGKKRTAIVVYNGTEGSRAAINKFEKQRIKIEEKAGNLMLRDIERWDINIFVEKLWKYRDALMQNTEIVKFIEHVTEHHNIVLEFKDEYEQLDNASVDEKEKRTYLIDLAESFYKKIRDTQDRLGISKKVPLNVRKKSYGK